MIALLISEKFLGDGTMVLRFMTSLSDYYLGLTPALLPTFEKYLQPTPILEQHLVDDTLCLAPQLAEDISLQSFLRLAVQKKTITSHVEIKFALEQLKAICVVADREAINGISTSDALAAYLVTVLNRISTVAIANVTNIISVRFRADIFPAFPL